MESLKKKKNIKKNYKSKRTWLKKERYLMTQDNTIIINKIF